MAYLSLLLSSKIKFFIFSGNTWEPTWSIPKRKAFSNRPFPSSKKSHFQSEAKCEAIDMKMIFNYDANKTHFHNRGFALSLVLKVRFFGTRKWCIFKHRTLHYKKITNKYIFKGEPSGMSCYTFVKVISEFVFFSRFPAISLG